MSEPYEEWKYQVQERKQLLIERVRLFRAIAELIDIDVEEELQIIIQENKLEIKND